MKKIALFAAFLLAFAMTSCMDDNTYSVSVLMIKSTVADGRFGYVKLVDAGGTCQDTAKFWGRTAFLTGQAQVTIEDVGAGLYFACVFVDINNNAGATSASSPDTNDLWFDTADNIEVKDDIYITVNEGDWSAYY